MLRGCCWLSLFLLMTMNLSAQETTKAAVPIATIDILHIYKHHKPVAEKLEVLKQSAQELEKTLQIRQVELETLQRKLQSPPKPNEDREKMQLQLVKLQTELRLFLERERQQLQKREVAIQVETYKQVQAEVARLSKERGYKLVLVKAQRSLDSENIGEISLALNQVILLEDGLDITQDVLQALDQKAKSSP